MAVQNSASEMPPMPVDAAALDSANWWYAFSGRWLIWVGLLAAMTAAATVALGFIQWRSNATREVHSDLRTGMLEKEAAGLKAQVELAKVEIAKANATAATARLEQERLKAQLAWRVLPDEKAAALGKLLAQQPGKINIEHAAGDAEAQYLAIQIRKIFHQAKWETGLAAATYQHLIFGLWIPKTPFGGGDFVRDAFKTADIPFSAGQSLGMSSSFGDTIPGAATLIVGTKPIPK